MFIKAVLDTTVYGPEVHATFLLKECTNGWARNQAASGGEQEGPTTNYQHIVCCSSEVSPTASCDSIYICLVSLVWLLTTQEYIRAMCGYEN